MQLLTAVTLVSLAAVLAILFCRRPLFWHILTSMSVRLTVWPKCMLAASYAAPWWVTLIMRHTTHMVGSTPAPGPRILRGSLTNGYNGTSFVWSTPLTFFMTTLDNIPITHATVLLIVRSINNGLHYRITSENEEQQRTVNKFIFWLILSISRTKNIENQI